jgi:hypothetical protein
MVTFENSRKQMQERRGLLQAQKKDRQQMYR